MELKSLRSAVSVDYCLVRVTGVNESAALELTALSECFYGAAYTNKRDLKRKRWRIGISLLLNRGNRLR